MITPQLTKSQFKTFFLLYAAHIDYDYSTEEEDYIKTQASKDEYLAMYNLLNQNSEYGGLKIILNNKQCYLCDEDFKNTLYGEVLELFKVDGQYSRPEKVFLEFVDRLRQETS